MAALLLMNREVEMAIQTWQGIVRGFTHSLLAHSTSDTNKDCCKHIVFTDLSDPRVSGDAELVVYDKSTDLGYEPTFGIWERDEKTLYICSESGRFELPEDSSYSFSKFRNLEDIEGLYRIDTSNVKDMGHLFEDCRALEEINVSGLDVSGVTHMESAFCHCDSLKALDLSGWDTQNVVNASFIFAWCKNLKELDISSWTLDNAEYKTELFPGCESLTKVHYPEDMALTKILKRQVSKEVKKDTPKHGGR